MLYLTILVLLIVCSIISINLKKSGKFSDLTYYVIFSLLTFMLCFRYGQGTDYFNYKYLFNLYSDWSYVMTGSNHGEMGFRLLSYLFREHFEVFIFVVALGEMLLLNNFLKENSKNKTFSLLLFYTTFYLIYFCSALRQGMVLALFIGIGYKLFKEEKIFKYVLFVLLISTIHTVGLVYLLVPIITKIKLKTILTLLPIAIFFGIATLLFPIPQLMGGIPIIGAKLLANTGTPFSIYATAERLIILVAILLLFYTSRESEEDMDDNIANAFKVYIFGFILYFTFLPFATLATRAMLCFRVFEIIIIPYFIMRGNYIKPIFVAFILSLSVAFYVHNISNQIREGGYFSRVNVLNYPYISVFDKDEVYSVRNLFGRFID